MKFTVTELGVPTKESVLWSRTPFSKASRGPDTVGASGLLAQNILDLGEYL